MGEAGDSVSVSRQSFGIISGQWISSALASAVDGGRKVYMNMATKLVLAAGLTVLGGATAFGDFARGSFNNWANNCPLARPEGGNYYSGTLQAVDMGQDPGLKFDNDGNWGGNKWGAGTAAVVNETIGTQ